MFVIVEKTSMALAMHADIIANELIVEFGVNAKRKAIHSLIAAIEGSDNYKEELMREVFHRIMLHEQAAAHRELVQAE